VEPSRADQLLFAKHFERAQGWLLLEKFAEAARSLRAIPPAFRRRPEVVLVRAALYLAAKDWKRAEPVLRQVLKHEADDPQHWVNLAFAVRRAKSLAEAEPILLEARRRFPQVAVIWFNLACYAAQLGRLDEVPTLLREAIRLEPDFKEPAKADPDLAPYWQGKG
jgi:tetratricopeptide (TPR) repeat protein